MIEIKQDQKPRNILSGFVIFWNIYISIDLFFLLNMLFTQGLSSQNTNKIFIKQDVIIIDMVMKYPKAKPLLGVVMIHMGQNLPKKKKRFNS